MKNQIARQIWDRVRPVVESRSSASNVFGHKGKSSAIDFVWQNHEKLLREYLAADDKIEFLQSLPWIGGITKWDLAKNFGHDCAKPDRHLVRIAGEEGGYNLCFRLSEASGDRIGSRLLIWFFGGLLIWDWFKIYFRIQTFKNVKTSLEKKCLRNKTL